MSPENKDQFREYIEYLSDQTHEERSEAEKGPLSDIISSVFQYPSLFFVQNGKKCILPSFHNRDYYFDEEKGRMKVDRIFDEDFANFYALVANNCHKELEILRNLLGEEWFKAMENELYKSSKTMEMMPEKQTPHIMDQIKSTIIGERDSEIPKRIVEKEENIRKEGDWDRNE